MSVAPILDLRKAIVAHLRNDTSVTTTPVSNRIYGEKAPAKPIAPFVRYGVSDAEPGFNILAPIHVFAKDEFTDDVNAIAEAVGKSLDGAVLSLGDGRDAYLTWAGHRVSGREGEWFVTVTINARIPRCC
mgnify:CR=1 FL=1|jgi:hypothetical protein